jgi:hypothetical protein
VAETVSGELRTLVQSIPSYLTTFRHVRPGESAIKSSTFF